MSDQSLGLWENDKPVLVYNHGLIARPEVQGARARACYFHPVYGLDGEVLTDDFPKDHLYHRGMYWAWPHIKINDQEYDLWSARGELRQVFRRWLAKEADAGGAKLGVENGWFAGDKQLVREQVQVDIHSRDGRQPGDRRRVNLDPDRSAAYAFRRGREKLWRLQFPFLRHGRRRSLPCPRPVHFPTVSSRLRDASPATCS